MPGTVVAAEAGGDLGGWSSGEPRPTFSLANSFRVSSVMDNLALQMQAGSQYDPLKFSQLCLALARGIDYAIGNNEVLATVQPLAVTLKQICQRRNNDDIRTAIMVLMVSVKNACKLGWFSNEDTEEFLALANEIARSYCSVRDISTRNSNPLSPLSDIMTKFFPLIQLGHILTSVEVKPGYEALVHDFLISKKIAHSPREKIMLIVAQTDIVQTSACIISPQKVNFLLNGKGVDRRTNLTMDSGPQMPTDVTRMLKYGTNLLQAVGQFNGHYLITIAFMSVSSSPDATTLLDHAQPADSRNDSDLDIIEGPSRISLNCPISYTRIKTPVKGQSCKHLQCFDFHNFVDINSRRPSWRCPHCNQNVCYSDIRIDRNISKILSEVGNNVSEVIISAEGSWKAVLENDDNMDSYKNETSNILEEGAAMQDSSLPNFVDLTAENYEMNSIPLMDEDMKPSHSSLNIPSAPVNVSQSEPAEIEDEFWSRILNPPFSSNSIADVQANGLSTANYASSSMHSQISSHTQRAPVAVQALPVQLPATGQQHRLRNHLNPLNVNSSLAHSSVMPSRDDSAHRNLERPPHLSRHHPHQVPNRPAVAAVRLAPPIQNQARDHPLLPRTAPPLPGPGLSQTPLPWSTNRPSPALSHFQNEHLNQTLNSRATQSIRLPNPSQQQFRAAQCAAPIARHSVQTPSPPTVPPFRPSFDRSSFGGRAHPISSTGDGVALDAPSDQDWRPSGQMRGSLSGRAYAGALDMFIIRPTQHDSSRPGSAADNSTSTVGPTGRV